MANDSLSVFGSNAGYLAELYELYRADPSLVDPEWAAFFRDSGFGNGATNGHTAKGVVVSQPTVVSAYPTANSVADTAVDSFRRWGHLKAHLSPIAAGGIAREAIGEISNSTYLEGKKTAELSLQGYAFGGRQHESLPSLLEYLNKIYCGTIGFECEHIISKDEREWLRGQIETRFDAQSFTNEDRREIFTQLLRGEMLESELHKKYVGAKRFSLEGNETLMPMVAELARYSCESEISEIVLGMAHRGRLNILVNTLRKPLEQLFAEFEDKTLATVVGAGDVKYHLGYDTEYAFGERSIKLSLAPNPSHLEFVNPVAEGIARAKQDSLYARNRKSVLPVLMHGDAAFAGQGIVFESLNYSGLEGYTTGGTFHIVINNQIGFTTTPDESRSTRYCTDLAKGLDIPVFHVNAEDPEAACWVIRVALKYRNTFGKSVLIDLIGHRKYGHNEGDDPTFTQPQTYSEVKAKQPIWRQYAEELKEKGVVDDAYVGAAEADYRKEFADAQARVKPTVDGEVVPLHGKLQSRDVHTAVEADILRGIAKELVNFPEGFVPHPKLAKIIQKRVETVEAGQDIEWGVAEALAFGSLVEQGVAVRLSGQDCRRGTFSHRHLVLDDYEKPGIWSPLSALAARLGNGGRFDVYNSSLSESAIVGFEFGYAATDTAGLTMWEAQFGDFANGAQVMIDQFISSSESKWSQLSGVTLLLPHGFEGQGPEHSSARLERYLQLCAEGNMSVCYPSTAAQHFHLLRRQGLREIKRPLIVMTPKSLLRLPSAMSSLKDFTDATFQPLLVDPSPQKGKATCDTVVLMTGKVYHDVKVALKDKEGVSARIARVEELYPFPAEKVAQLMSETKASRVIWVQEEPQNQGAWSYVAPLLKEVTGKDALYIGRAAASATATGSGKHSALEQKWFLDHLMKELVVGK